MKKKQQQDRMITTLEELAQLPYQSLFRSACGYSFIVVGQAGEGIVRSAGDEDDVSTWNATCCLPCRVLWRRGDPG